MPINIIKTQEGGKNDAYLHPHSFVPMSLGLNY